MLNSVLEYQLPIAQAAEIMGLSQRHTKRLLAAYRRDGPAALAHGNRDRRPHNAVPEAAVAAVVKLANNTYAGANHTHFTELLRDREGIDLSRPTVRRILAKAGMGSPRSRRSSQHRFRRAPGGHGQIDGSHHPCWRSGGPRRCHRRRGPSGLPHRGGHSGLIWCCRVWSGSGESPFRLSNDNARQAPVLAESTQFARVCGVTGRSTPSPPRPREGWSGWGTGWSPNCAWQVLPPSRRPTTASAQVNAQFAVAAEQPDLPPGIRRTVSHRDHLPQTPSSR